MTASDCYWNDESCEDAGYGSSGSSSGSTTVTADSVWKDANTAAQVFQDKVGAGLYGSYDRCYNGCTSLSAWFIGEYTNLTYGDGNGVDVVDRLVEANIGKGVTATDYPVAPAIFSSTDGNWWASGSAGHTGLVVKVEGDIATVVHTAAKNCNDTPWITEMEIPRDFSKVKFVNLGDYLK